MRVQDCEVRRENNALLCLHMVQFKMKIFNNNNKNASKLYVLYANKISLQGVVIAILLYFDRHCPALSQPFTKRVLLDQHIQLTHGVKDPEGKTVKSANTEALPDKKTVL